jgi:hypothetical protein
VQLFQVDCDFSTCDIHQNDRLSSFAKRSEKTWKTVTLGTKMVVIRKMEAGEKRANAFSSLGLALATVLTVMANAEKIKQTGTENYKTVNIKCKLH